MGAWIHEDGRIVCAAMHPLQPRDQYLDDAQLYEQASRGDLRPSPTHLHAEGCDGVDCRGSIIGGAGVPLCGDGLWI